MGIPGDWVTKVGNVLKLRVIRRETLFTHLKRAQTMRTSQWGDVYNAPATEMEVIIQPCSKEEKQKELELAAPL